MKTPQSLETALAKEVGVSKVYFKREDLHPYGSHKGRSIPYMIDEYVLQGKKAFAISSSGNAALAALLYIKEHNTKKTSPLSLTIFVGMHIQSSKLSILQKLSDEHTTIIQTERPLQSLFTLIEESDVTALRQSNDDLALIGYTSLAQELLEIKDLNAVFIPTSSGTTAQALAEVFKKEGRNIEIYIVQTMSCHPLAEQFVDVLQTDEVSLADAIVDKTALRKDALTPLIEANGGGGFIATNEEITSAIELAEKYTGTTLSPNSALSLAGLMHATYTGKTWHGAVVCLITGK